MSLPPRSASVRPDASFDPDPIDARTVERLRPYLDAAGTENPEPLALVDVLAGGRPAAWIYRPSGLARAAFDDILAAVPVQRRRPPRGPGYVLATDPARFEHLPAAGADDDSFDRRMGDFLGYPCDAVEAYVERGSPTTRRGATLVEAGQITPAAFAYAKFVPWVRPLSTGALERQIADGKHIADRLLAINARSGARSIAASVAGVYHAERRRLAAKRRATDGVFGRVSLLDDDRSVRPLLEQSRSPADTVGCDSMEIFATPG